LEVWIMLRHVILFAVVMPCLAFAQGTIVPPPDRPVPVRWGPWAIRSHRVSFTIKEGVAETRVEQVFENLGDRPLEAVYVFPVAAGANVSRLTVTDGDKLMEAKVLPAEEARHIYDDIVRRVRDPALLEYVGSRLLRLSLFPIPPHGERKVTLTYSETLQREGGAYRYVYPMRLDCRSEKQPQRVSLDGTIEMAQPIQTVYSPSHPETSVRPDGLKRARVSWESGREYHPRDFQLFVKSGGDGIGLSVLPYRTEGDGYFLLFLSPRLYEPEKEIPKSIVFTFDHTGSMKGEKIGQAKAALRYCIEHLRPMDRFEVVLFNEAPDRLFRGLVEASRENISKALRFVDEAEARGGTNIQDALDASLDALLDARSDGFRAIVFLTDGLPTVGETDGNRISRHIRDRNEGDRRARLYSFGVGRDVDSRLLDRLALDARGDSNYVLEGEEIQTTVEGFFEKVSVPALSDIDLRFEGFEAYDLFPREQRDLFRGSAIVLAARYRGDGRGRVVVNGQGARGREESHVDVDMSGRHDRDDFVPRVWAARKIAYLLDQVRLDGQAGGEVRDEIVRLSLEFGIITPLTSFLITEDQAVPPHWRVPAMRRGELPAGHELYDLGAARGGMDVRNQIDTAMGGFGGAAEAGEALSGLRKAGGGGYVAPGKEGVFAGEPEYRWSAGGTGRPAEGARAAGDRVFYLANGIWTDSKLDPKAEIVEIKAFSDAHMVLIGRVKKLASYSTVGIPLVVQLEGAAVLIGEKGKETLTDAELKKLVGE
jgi:Ca-activated chloride channel family protein